MTLDRNMPWNLGLSAGGRVGVRYTLGIIWFALVGQSRLVLAPEEAFAIAASESD